MWTITPSARGKYLFIVNLLQDRDLNKFPVSEVLILPW